MMLLPCALLFVALQDAAPAQSLPVSPSASTSAAAAPSGSATDLIHSGLQLYWRHRYQQAAAQFEQAMAADPQSAAAAYYAGYSYYKLGEPKKRMDENKTKAEELFAKAYGLDPNFRPDWGKPAPPAAAKQ